MGRLSRWNYFYRGDIFCLAIEECKYEMRISGNKSCTRAVCAMEIWHCAILLGLRQASDAHEWVDPGASSTSIARRNRFNRQRMFCVWWNQRSVVDYEQLKPGKSVTTKRYQQQLTDLNRSLLEKAQNTERGNTTFSSWHIFLRDNAPSHTHSAGRFYSAQLIHQISILLITTYLHRWVTHLSSGALIRTKMWKNGSVNGSQQKGKVFTGVIFTNCQKIEKMYNKRRSILWRKQFLSFFRI